MIVLLKVMDFKGGHSVAMQKLNNVFSLQAGLYVT